MRSALEFKSLLFKRLVTTAIAVFCVIAVTACGDRLSLPGSLDLSSVSLNSNQKPQLHQPSAKCTDFVNSLGRYASGQLSHAPQAIIEAHKITQNESLLELSKFYGSVRVEFSRADCKFQENFSRYWPLFLSGHLNSPDALEPKNIEYTNRLIVLAFRTGDPRPVGEIADVYGPNLTANIDWSAALVRSPQIASVLMERLWLLSQEWKDIKLRQEALTTLNRRSPNLLPLYHALARSRSAQNFIDQVPKQAKQKPKYVHQAVRSALNHFFSLKPSANQIRQLALWMHDYNELFHIQKKALERVSTAQEFLRVTDYYYNPAPPQYVDLARRFLRPKYNAFLNLEPSSEELGEFSKRIQDVATNSAVLADALKEAKSAGEFISVAKSNAGSSPSSLQAMSKTLESYVQRFAQLEPNAEQINDFRRLLGKGNAELQLLRFVLPKLVSASEFLKIARLHGQDQERRGDEFSVGLRSILIEHIEMYLSVSPTVDEINGYRLRVMDVASDAILIEAGLKVARSAREMLLVATLLGLEPPHSPTAFDEMTTKALVKTVDSFIGLKPNLNEVQAYRARMANPQADLKLVDHALKIAATRDEVFSVISRRPMLRTAAFEKAWSETLERNWTRLKTFLISKNDRGLFLREIPDRAVSERLRVRL